MEKKLENGKMIIEGKYPWQKRLPHYTDKEVDKLSEYCQRFPEKVYGRIAIFAVINFESASIDFHFCEIENLIFSAETRPDKSIFTDVNLVCSIPGHGKSKIQLYSTFHSGLDDTLEVLNAGESIIIDDISSLTYFYGIVGPKPWSRAQQKKLPFLETTSLSLIAFYSLIVMGSFSMFKYIFQIYL